ncbi:hypothetical protein LSAT2_006027 [Lamellibrachia satsuma]|nr:hypothetical protein LSAT2_006027 [Lamellibrachia satsuma]
MRAAYVVVAIVAYFSVLSESTANSAPQRLQQRLVNLERRFTKQHRRLTKTSKLAAQLAKQLAGVDAARGMFSDGPPCPDGTPGFYHSAEFSSCYHLEPATVLTNWTDALALCQILSPASHLVSIESKDEQRLLRAKWNNDIGGVATYARFWTSGQLTAGQWKWTATGKKMKYENWIPLMTNDDNRFQCAAVYSNEAYSWGGAACWAPHMVTCEINL